MKWQARRYRFIYIFPCSDELFQGSILNRKYLGYLTMIIWKYRSRIWLAQPIRNTIRNWSNDCNCLWANSKRGETVCKRGKTRGENNHAYSNFIRQIVSHVFLPVRSAKNQEELSQSFHAYLYQFYAMPQHAILMNCHEICMLRNEKLKWRAW